MSNINGGSIAVRVEVTPGENIYNGQALVGKHVGGGVYSVGYTNGRNYDYDEHRGHFTFNAHELVRVLRSLGVVP